MSGVLKTEGQIAPLSPRARLLLGGNRGAIKRGKAADLVPILWEFLSTTSVLMSSAQMIAR